MQCLLLIQPRTRRDCTSASLSSSRTIGSRATRPLSGLGAAEWSGSGESEMVGGECYTGFGGGGRWGIVSPSETQPVMRDIARRLVVYQVALQSFQVRKLYARMPHGIPAGCTRSLPASYPHPTCTHLYSTCTLPSPAVPSTVRTVPRAVLYIVPCCHVHRLPWPCRTVPHCNCNSASAAVPVQWC